MGVLANQGVDQAWERWSATFQTYLTQVAGPPLGASFRMLPLPFGNVSAAVAAGQVDFLFSNPAIFACMESKHGVRPLVTLSNLKVLLAEDDWSPGGRAGGSSHSLVVLYTPPGLEGRAPCPPRHRQGGQKGYGLPGDRQDMPMAADVAEGSP